MSRIAFAMNYVPVSLLKELTEQLTHICSSTKWHGRRAAMEFIQILIFSNLFNARPHTKQIKQIVFQCLFDEQLEVRSLASVALAGFYQCGYLPITKEDLVSSSIVYGSKSNACSSFVLGTFSTEEQNEISDEDRREESQFR